MLNFSFPRYLTFLFALLAVGLCASGAISWIASNWSLWDKALKLFTVEAAFAFSLIAGVVAYWWESRRQLPYVQSQLWLFLAAVLIGGLFALIGQIYQTGANAWQLFALWALFQLPLFWVLPNVANGLLWLVTLNTAAVLALLLQGQSLAELLWLVALNLPLLWAFERFSPTLGDRWWVLPNLLFAWLLALFVIGAELEHDMNAIRFGFWAVAAGLVWYYRRYHTFLLLGFAYAVVDLNVQLMHVYGVDIGTFIALNLFATLIAALLFQRIHSRCKSILLLGLVGVVALFITAFVLFQLKMELATLTFLPLGLFLAGVVISNQQFRSLFLALSALTGAIHYGMVLIWDEIWLPIELQLVLLWLFLALIYWQDKTFWLRSLLIFIGLCSTFATFDPFLFGGSLGAEPRYFVAVQWGYLLLPLCCLAAFVAVSEGKVRFSPAAWASLVFLFLMFGMQAGRFSQFFDNVQTEFHSIGELFHAITLGAFQPERWSILHIAQWVSSFAPVWLAAYLIYRQKLRSVVAVLTLLTAALISIGFIAQPAIGLLFSLLLIANQQAKNTLWFVALAALVGFLGLFYYNLTISLLFKAFLLLIEGVLLAAIAFGLHFATREKSASPPAVGIKKTAPLVALMTLLATLATANFSVWKFEDILQNGEKIVLKLAPRDPRSLMQGDYMELNYAILAGLNNLDSENHTAQQQIYVKLHTHRGIDEFCGYTRETPPTEFDGCRTGIYLPLKVQQHHIQMAGQDFFFPEGQRAYFEQAEYGEFRFKDGKLLLLRLLDGELKAL